MSQIKSICHTTHKLLQHPHYQILCSVVVIAEMSCGKFCAHFLKLFSTETRVFWLGLIFNTSCCLKTSRERQNQAYILVHKP